MIGRETNRMKRSIHLTLRARTIGMALVCALGVLTAQGVNAADAPISLQSIDVQSISGSQTQLTLHLSGPAPQPQVFTIDKPARLSLDLPNTSLALASRRIDVGNGGIDTVLAAEANGRSRVVLNLDTPMTYQTQVNGNDIVLTVGGNANRAAPQVASSAKGTSDT